MQRAEERARGEGRASDTHLDLGRLEGRDGAGEGGGNARHFCVWVWGVVCVFVCGNDESAGRREIFISFNKKCHLTPLTMRKLWLKTIQTGFSYR